MEIRLYIKWKAGIYACPCIYYHYTPLSSTILPIILYYLMSSWCFKQPRSSYMIPRWYHLYPSLYNIHSIPIVCETIHNLFNVDPSTHVIKYLIIKVPPSPQEAPNHVLNIESNNFKYSGTQTGVFIIIYNLHSSIL